MNYIVVSTDRVPPLLIMPTNILACILLASQGVHVTLEIEHV